MKAKFTLVVVIGLISILLAFAIGCGGGQADYQTGYNAGYEVGYDVDYDLGRNAYDAGYADGYAACQAESAAEEPEPPPSQPEAFEPITITGAGSKTSAPFEVTTDEWLIEWSYRADDPEMAGFYFFVYPRGETVMYVESIMAGDGETSGATYCYAGRGEYYVEVLAANINRWEITISPAP